MTTSLKRLLEASKAVFPLIYIGRWEGEDPARTQSRRDFETAIQAAQTEVNAQTGANVQTVIDKSWNLGWLISRHEAMIALAAVLECGERKIMAIKVFRTRTGDGGRDYTDVNLLKRAKDIIEVAQEVLKYGV